MRSWLKPSLVGELSDTEAAWLAGFFDGEGSLTSFLAKKKYPTWVITIPNTHYGSLEWCQKIAGGAGRIVKRACRGNRKPQWVWRVHRQREIVDLLRQMLPFLVVKHEAVERYLLSWKDIGL